MPKPPDPDVVAATREALFRGMEHVDVFAAALGGKSRKTALRILRRHGVPTMRIGNAEYVNPSTANRIMFGADSSET